MRAGLLFHDSFLFSKCRTKDECMEFESQRRGSCKRYLYRRQATWSKRWRRRDTRLRAL